MGNFTEAYVITNKNEGGYSDNSSDSGGETLFGVSRNNWPNWPGWKIVDEFKGQPKWVSIIESSQQLRDLASQFYKSNFWDVLSLDQINDQQICNTVYDFGVNSGTGKSAKYLQISAGVNADGIIGHLTIDNVNGQDAKELYNTFNVMREAFYRGLAENPSQAQFLHSWLSRLTPYK